MSNRNNIIIHHNNIMLNLYKEDNKVIDFPKDEKIRLDILGSFLNSGVEFPFQIVNKNNPLVIAKGLVDSNTKANIGVLYVTLHGYNIEVGPGSQQNEINEIFKEHILDVLVDTKINRIRTAMRNVLEYKEPTEFLGALNKFLLNVVS